MDGSSNDPRCMGCKIPVRHGAIKFCSDEACQKAACAHYRVEYRPFSVAKQREYERQQRARRNPRPTDSKGYGEHAGRRQLDQER